MSSQLSKVCPHCSASLPLKASFCPYCAQKILSPQPLSMPTLGKRKRQRRRIWGLAPLFILFLCIGVSLALPRFLSTRARPRTYEGEGEISYSGADGRFYLALGTMNTQEQPMAEQIFYTMPGYDGMGQVPLFVHHPESGKNSAGFFLHKLKSFSVELLQEEGDSLSCEEPKKATDTVPGSTLVCNVRFKGQAGRGKLLWTLEMDSGNTIQISQNLEVKLLPVRSYHWKDYPMETMEQLQSVVAQAEKECAPEEIIQLHLPSVTYAGTLKLSHPTCLYGSQEGETVFQDGIQLLWVEGPDCYFHDLVFRSSGDGTGLSSRGHLHLNRCTFSGFDTGLLADGTGTIYTSDCLFIQNQVAIHLTGSPPKRRTLSFYQTQFLQNSTGLLLEQEPMEVPINLYGSVFRENRQDIQNPANQALELSSARFF